jgi:hypothetical protein
MKSPPKVASPTLPRILLHSGFWTKCGAPHFAPLLLRALYQVANIHQLAAEHGYGRSGR